MADAHTSSEEDDFCRISDGGQYSDQEDEARLQDKEEDTQQTETSPSMPQISEYCQVVFQNVAESYKPGKPLECYYTLSPVLVPSQRDYIAVFKVGWNSVRSYVTFDYAPYPKHWKPNQEFKQCVLFGKNYVPREEDGEFYQFCYIDSTGKMRGASTPFQFLETPMEDFMEISDESLDILMIQTKKSHNNELVVQLTAERDGIASEKSQLEKEKNQLVGKVEELEAALSVKEEEVKEFTAKVESIKETMKQIPALEGKLAATGKELGELQAEKQRYEESLQQTTEAFMEVQDNITHLEAEKNKLDRELEDLTKERDEFKGQFASSETENETLRNEIDHLKHQLMDINEQNQIILAKEGVLKEEKQKVEQQLLVASSDQDHKTVLEAQIRDLETAGRKSEEKCSKLNEQIKAMGDFHSKLVQEYESSTIECDSLKMKLTRQGDDFLQKQKRMEQQLSLVKHEGKERRLLLEEQVMALKEGIQKLAKEKENLVQGRMGSEEASHIAVKCFKDKLTKVKSKADDESRKRLQIQKELLDLKDAYQSEKGCYESQVEYYKKMLQDSEEDAQQKERDAGKEINSLKVRLEMAREEYKILYREVRSSENNAQKETKTDVSQLLESPVKREIETVESSMPPDADLSYESRDMTLNMEQMARQISQLTQELEKRTEKITDYQTRWEKEKVRSKQFENLYKEMQETKRDNENELRRKYKEKQLEISEWKDKFNKLLDDYMKTKHAYESVKYDRDLTKETVRSGKPQPAPRDQSDSTPITPRPPPPFKYRNPYKKIESEDSSLQMRSPPGKYNNPYTSDTQSGISHLQSIDVKNPPGNLPAPLLPQQTPEAKYLSVKASLQEKSNNGRSPSAPPMGVEEEDEDIYKAGSDEDRSENGAFPPRVESDGVRNDQVRPPSPVYHDAQEYPVGGQVCAVCKMVFPPQISDQDLAVHMQSHFTYQCDVCQSVMDKEDSQIHRQSHIIDEDLQQFCPFCRVVFTDKTPEQLEEHVQAHITN